MKLFSSLLSLIAILALMIAIVGAGSEKNESSTRQPGRWTRTEIKDIKSMTENQIQAFEKKFGFNPRKAEEQMAELRKLAHNKETTPSKAGQELKEKIKQRFGNVKITKPANDSEADIPLTNQRAGLVDLLYEGDMTLTDKQFNDLKRRMMANETRAKRQVDLDWPKWTNNEIFYYFDSSISEEKAARIETAIEYISSRTCLNFYKSEEAENRIKFFNGDGCFSAVGMIGGEQDISIADGCQVIGIVVHEIMHALGVLHSQSRYDRDDYVAIDLTYVSESNRYNFDILNEQNSENVTPYEYGSTMHYGATAFVDVNAPEGSFSIESYDSDYMFTMGTNRISHYDMQIINKVYGCTCPEDSITCENGGYPNPADCSKCLCPYGFGGDNCAEVPNDGCGGQNFEATEEWQTAEVTLGVDSGDNRFVYDYCTNWISAPEGRTIEVVLISVSNTYCDYGCTFNGIEFKVKDDIQTMNPLYCCEEHTNYVISSVQNPTPVIAYSLEGLSSFQFVYRYV